MSKHFSEWKLFNPWRRKRSQYEEGFVFPQYSFDTKFDARMVQNIGLDLKTKKAALKASPSVVSLVSRTGGKDMFICSGTIIDCENINGTFFGTILTSASLLTHPMSDDDDDDEEEEEDEQKIADDLVVDVYLSDGKHFVGQVLASYFHYNIATIRIESDAPLPTSIIRHLDDSMEVDPGDLGSHGDVMLDSKAVQSHHFEHTSSSFQLRRHEDNVVDSNLFNIRPGDKVIALGRHRASLDIMAAPGEISAERGDLDCEELWMTSCRITKCGIGGPVINYYGEVIGISFCGCMYTLFLPVNIVSKCLEHLKKYERRVYRPSLGMQVTNLYLASAANLEKIIQKFPNIRKGVIVENVIPGSPADCAGIRLHDVIVQCDGHSVGSLLKFYGVIWDKAGNSVNVVVIRADGLCLNLSMIADKTTPDKYNRWPIPKDRKNERHERRKRRCGAVKVFSKVT